MRTLAVLALVALALTGAAVALAAPGDLDSTFAGDGSAVLDFGGINSGRAVALQPDGKIVVAGRAGDGYGVARLNPDGTPDTTFSGDGRTTIAVAGPANGAEAVLVQPDGKILLGGSSTDNFALVRLLADGTPDTGFDGDGTVTTDIFFADRIHDLALQADGKIIAAGASANKFGVARYTEAGALDTSFNPCTPAQTDTCNGVRADEFQNGQAFGVAIAADGDIVMAGEAVITGGNSDMAIARYTSGGVLDTSFSGDGLHNVDLSADDSATDLALLSDGRLVLTGFAVGDTAVVRLGSDTTNEVQAIIDLGGNDRAEGVAVDAEGRIVVAGTNSSDFVVARLTAAGALDPAFSGDGKAVDNLGGSDVAQAVALQGDGKIVAAGGDGFSFIVARYDAEPGPVATTSPVPTGTATAVPTASPTASPTATPAPGKYGTCARKKGRKRAKCIKRKCGKKKGKKKRRCIKTVTRKPKGS